MKVRWRGGGMSLAQRRDFMQQLQSLTGDIPLPAELNPKEFQGFHLALLNKVSLCDFPRGNQMFLWQIFEALLWFFL